MKKLLSTRLSENQFSFGIFILRAVAGGLMIPHGYDKMEKFNVYVAQFIDPFHVGLRASLSLVIFAEFFCSIFIVLGLFTRFACIPLIIGMGVALIIAHHWDVFGDGQMAALFLSIFLTILIVGPGKFSLDRMIAK